MNCARVSGSGVRESVFCAKMSHECGLKTGIYRLMLAGIYRKVNNCENLDDGVPLTMKDPVSSGLIGLFLFSDKCKKQF